MWAEAVRMDVIRLIASDLDATLLDGTGCYEGAERQILYSVIGREQVDAVIAAIHRIDPKAFINVINTEQINGRFYRTPTR